MGDQYPEKQGPPPPGAVVQQPGGYPPPQQYPPPQGGALPPQQPGYAPPQPGYAPQQPGYGQPPPGYAPQPGGVVMQQPGYNNPAAAGGQQQYQWMAPPPPPAGCPPGLEYLAQIDQLIVKQQIEVLEMVTGFETNNKYRILNSVGQQVYFALEDTDCCTRQCCGPMREFNMKILDNANNEVMHLYRPYRCMMCCCPGFLQEIEISAPPGTPVGYVQQKWSLCTPGMSPKFDICDEQKNPILRIEGPGCVIGCCSDIEFKVLALDGSEVGKVTKQWMGMAREMFTDADNFGITFPMDLDVKAKACMLGAVMLIDFMFFEQQNQNNNH